MPERRLADATAHKELSERLQLVEETLVDHIHPEIDQLLEGQEDIATALLGPLQPELLGGGRDASKGIIFQAAADRKTLHRKIADLKGARLSTSERVTLLVSCWRRWRRFGRSFRIVTLWVLLARWWRRWAVEWLIWLLIICGLGASGVIVVRELSR